MLFTVIVPVYKVEAYLERCVDSILRQTFTDFEVILVDDGSPDRCPAICDEYARKDSRVRVIHKPNGGLVSARNAGIMAARGDYICYVDSDDWAAPGMLEFVQQKLAESPVPLDMVLFAAEIVYRDSTDVFDNRVPEGYYDRARLEKEIFPIMLTDRRGGFRMGKAIQAQTWNKVCRRELQIAHYMRDERIRIFTDVPLTYECLLNCQNVYICNEHLYYYNKTNEQSIRAKSGEYLLSRSFYYLVTYLQDRLRGYGPDIDRQLNDYPAALIIRTADGALKSESGIFSAARRVRAGLKETGMLRYISLRGLPPKQALVILLFKLHLDRAAVRVCSIRKAELRRYGRAE